jgi:hypothetical protein
MDLNKVALVQNSVAHDDGDTHGRGSPLGGWFLLVPARQTFLPHF